MTVRRLTPKQEKFCQAVVRGENQSEAYRLAYGVKKATTKTINERASRLMANSKVVARVTELRVPVLKAVQYDQASWLNDLERRARFDVRELFDADGKLIPVHELSDAAAAGLASFEVLEECAGNGDSREVAARTMKIKIIDKLRALELFGKAMGFYIDHTIPPASELENATTEVLLAMRDMLVQRLQAKEIPHDERP